MRQVVSLLVFFTMLIGSTAAGVAAQEATPTATDAFGNLGLPELHVTLTATGFEGVPEEIEAGRYLVTITAAEDLEFGGGAGFVRPPEGMTVDDYLAALEAEVGPSEVEGEVPGGTPILADEATPVENEPPQSIFDATYAGGIFAPSGQSSQVVLDLTPGEWLVWADDPEAAQPPVPLTVTGEMLSNLPELEAAATMIMGEMVIEVTEGELMPGQQVIELQNIGAQPHFIFVGKVPDTVTEADVAAVLEADMTGTPATVDWNPDEEFEDVLGTGTQSGGTTIWVPVTLEAGTYAAVCFFPDTESGIPHAYEGMYAVFEVSE